MATECIAVVRGKRIRVTQLDECGAPDLAGSYVTSDGFVTATLSVEVEAGEEIIVKNADGRFCINEKSDDAIKRLNVEIDWCQVDPDLISIITGSPVELDGEDSVGFRIKEGTVDAKWALEIWTGLAGGQCEGDPCFGYLLVPFVAGSVLTGDVTVQNGETTFQTGGFTKGGSEWGVGPWNVIGTPGAEGPLDVAIAADEHALLRKVCVPPPAAVCGAQAIPGSPS